MIIANAAVIVAPRTTRREKPAAACFVALCECSCYVPISTGLEWKMSAESGCRGHRAVMRCSSRSCLTPGRRRAWPRSAGEQRLKHGLTGKLLAPEQLHMGLIGLRSDLGVHAGLRVGACRPGDAGRSSDHNVVVRSDARSGQQLGAACGARSCSAVARAFAARPSMQLAIEIAMHELGIGVAGRRHVPHVMVLDGWRGSVEEAIEPVRWTATEFVLLHSLRSRREPVVLGRWALGKDIDRPRGFREPAIAIGW